ncbi:enoyl-CoA hydratase-related protein [Elusimicrobiota bacterium]
MELEIEKNNLVAYVYLNRPQALNALSKQLILDLMETLENLDKDKDVRVIVIAGRGKAFAAGADIKEMQGLTTEDLNKTDQFASWERVRKISKPIIAAVHGFALGGGMELAMSADMIIASESAKFGQPEILLGIIPGAGGTQRLTKLAGKNKAMELILTGDKISARQAQEIEVVNRVVPDDKFMEEVQKLAQKIASMSPLALKAAKEAINKAQDLPLGEGLALERKLFYDLFSTKDQKEGMKAFVEKRKAVFTGT